MEPVFQSHPVPQNVTNFEFHLVGDMTLKQFGYLAAGLGFAFLTFTTLATKQPIIAWPIIIISSLLGVAFAFLPIQERPLDHWVKAFFHSIFKPTRLSYQSKILSKDDPFFKKRLNYYLDTHIYNPQIVVVAPPINTSTPQTPISREPSINQPMGKVKKPNYIERFKQQQTFVSAQIPPQPVSQPVSATTQSQPQPAPSIHNVVPQLTTGFMDLPQGDSLYESSARIRGGDRKVLDATPAITQPLTPAPTPQPTPPALKDAPPDANDLKKTVELAKEAQETKDEIVKIEKSIGEIKNYAAQPGVDPKKYIEQFQELLTELQKLNERASSTAKDLAIASNQTPEDKKPEALPVQAKIAPSIKLTGFANVINGVITDSKGNYIEGAIVVAHDKQGLPVRALKSNKLGQFVAATPLANGEYTIEVEKDDLVFDRIALDLKNEVLPSIVVSAKKVAYSGQGTVSS